MSGNRKIIGVTVGTTTPRANLNQTDPKKADYVRGREALAGKLDANQGAENANKALFVGSDGKVIPKAIDAVSGKDGGFYMPSLNIVDEDTISIGFQYYSSGTPMGVIPPKNIDLPAGKDGHTPQKNVDYFDGKDGVTPHIGANGNWFVGDTDTGKPSCGEVDGETVFDAVENYFAENPVVTEESDPTVPAWAKKSTKPSYTKSEVGLGNVDNVKQYSADNPPPYPVTSVNGKTGAVSLSASDVGARPNTWTPSATDVGADPKGTASNAVTTHNVATDAHNDLRLLIDGLTSRLNALANSTDEELDQMAELVSYIKENRELISGITTDKVNVADIINNLTTNVSNKPLSAAQGVALKALIDAITIPTKVSQLTNDKGYITGYTETDPTVPAWAKAASKPSYTASEVGALPSTTKIPAKTSDLTNDSGFITGYTETDPTVPSWAKASSKPSYTKSEIGLGNVENVKQYSANNPPPYPVTSVNGKTGAVTVDVPSVPSWAMATSKPSYTASEVGAVPTSRKVNGKALSADISLSASDVGARASTWTPSAAEVKSALGYTPANQATTITITGKDADGETHTFTVVGWEA